MRKEGKMPSPQRSPANPNARSSPVRHGSGGRKAEDSIQGEKSWRLDGEGGAVVLTSGTGSGSAGKEKEKEKGRRITTEQLFDPSSSLSGTGGGGSMNDYNKNNNRQQNQNPNPKKLFDPNSGNLVAVKKIPEKPEKKEGVKKQKKLIDGVNSNGNGNCNSKESDSNNKGKKKDKNKDKDRDRDKKRKEVVSIPKVEKVVVPKSRLVPPVIVRQPAVDMMQIMEEQAKEVKAEKVASPKKKKEGGGEGDKGDKGDKQKEKKGKKQKEKKEKEKSPEKVNQQKLTSSAAPLDVKAEGNWKEITPISPPSPSDEKAAAKASARIAEKRRRGPRTKGVLFAYVESGDDAGGRSLMDVDTGLNVKGDREIKKKGGKEKFVEVGGEASHSMSLRLELHQ